MKLCQDGDACVRYPDIHKIKLDLNADRLLMDRSGVVTGGARNGGCQALNIAMQFGARFIVLVGFDMVMGADGKAHWHGNHSKNLGNPRAATMEKWRAYLDGQAGWLASHGIEVINASPVSALRNYPKMSLSEALDRFDSCQRASA